MFMAYGNSVTMIDLLGTDGNPMSSSCKMQPMSWMAGCMWIGIMSLV